MFWQFHFSHVAFPLTTIKNTVTRSTASEIISVIHSTQIINLILCDYLFVLNWTDTHSYMGKQHNLGIPPASNLTDSSFIFLSSNIKKNLLLSEHLIFKFLYVSDLTTCTWFQWNISVFLTWKCKFSSGNYLFFRDISDIGESLALTQKPAYFKSSGRGHFCSGHLTITPCITDSVECIISCLPLISLSHKRRVGEKMVTFNSTRLAQPQIYSLFQKHNQISRTILCRISESKSFILYLKILSLHSNTVQYY